VGFQFGSMPKEVMPSSTPLGRLVGPTTDNVKVIEEAEQLVGVFAQAVDTFYTSDWPSYKKQVEEAKLSWFKE
jgi:hypothetical protein